MQTYRPVSRLDSNRSGKATIFPEEQDGLFFLTGVGIENQQNSSRPSVRLSCIKAVSTVAIVPPSLSRCYVATTPSSSFKPSPLLSVTVSLSLPLASSFCFLFSICIFNLIVSNPSSFFSLARSPTLQKFPHSLTLFVPAEQCKRSHDSAIRSDAVSPKQLRRHWVCESRPFRVCAQAYAYLRVRACMCMQAEKRKETHAPQKVMRSVPSRCRLSWHLLDFSSFIFEMLGCAEIGNVVLPSDFFPALDCRKYVSCHTYPVSIVDLS